MKRQLICAACAAVLAFTSCHKEPTPTPTPEPQTVTRLDGIKSYNSTTVYPLETFVSYTWDKDVLTHEYDSIFATIITYANHNIMTYENGNLVKIEEGNGKWQNFFTYENGLIKTYLDIHDGDSMCWCEVKSFTADGNIEELVTYDNFKTTKWSLTWENGDAIKVVEDIIEPAELAKTNVYTYTYDDKPNIFTGFPLAYAVIDGSGVRIATRASKHNMKSEGYTYNYDEKGFLTSMVKENDSTFYHYIEQTLD